MNAIQIFMCTYFHNENKKRSVFMLFQSSADFQLTINLSTQAHF